MLPGGRIATFYSYKGGTGRSMALANFAWVLASNGYRVLAIDWDLEAPGLHRYFRPFLIDPDLVETDGLIDAFWNLATLGLQTLDKTPQSGEEPLSVQEIFDGVTRRLNCKAFFGDQKDDGYIDFICAGQQSKAYSERVHSFDWRHFYEIGGAAILETAKANFRAKYDWVLIDSRTGVSDTSGICTMQMPSIVVPCFTLNRQSIDGVAAILRSIREYQSATVIGSEIDFYPVATRIENAEAQRLEVARDYARATFAPFLPPAFEGPDSDRDYWSRMEISYRPKYAFEETLAAFGDGTGRLFATDSMLSQLHELSKLVSGNADMKIREIQPADRDEIAKSYALAAAKPERAERKAAAEAVLWGAFLRNLRAKEWKWLRSGKPRRLLLSRAERTELAKHGGAGEWSEEGSSFFGYDGASKLALDYDRIARWAHVPLLTVSAALAWLLYNALAAAGETSGSRLATAGGAALAILFAMVMFGVAMCSGLWLADRRNPLRPAFLASLLPTLEGVFAEPIRDYARYDGGPPGLMTRIVRWLRPLSIVAVPVLLGTAVSFAMPAPPDPCAAPSHDPRCTAVVIVPPAHDTKPPPPPPPPPPPALEVELTADLLKQVMPRASDPEKWVKPLSDAMRRFGIVTRAHEAGFLAHFAYQTDGLNTPVMNLDFKTAARLMATWPGRFHTAASARPYLNNEAALGNYVFANIRGNANVASGDGYRFRPRGMLWGKDEYAGSVKAFAEQRYDLHPELVETPQAVAATSAWMWTASGQAAGIDAGRPLDYLKRVTAFGADSLMMLNGFWSHAQVAFNLPRAMFGAVTIYRVPGSLKPAQENAMQGILAKANYTVRFAPLPQKPPATPDIRFYHPQDNIEAGLVKALVEQSAHLTLAMNDRSKDRHAAAAHDPRAIEIWLPVRAEVVPPPPPPPSPTITIKVFSNDISWGAEQKKLLSMRFTGNNFVFKFGELPGPRPAAPEIRYFYKEDGKAAYEVWRLLGVSVPGLSAPILRDPSEAKTPPGTIEVWLVKKAPPAQQ